MCFIRTVGVTYTECLDREADVPLESVCCCIGKDTVAISGGSNLIPQPDNP